MSGKYSKLAIICLSILCIGACSQDPAPQSENGLVPIILQTDWYAQPEHGGFYQAVAKGYYEEEGMKVEIRPGGNMNGIPHLVASKRVHFSVGAIETMLTHRSRGIPLVSLFPYFQHDPQCVLFHKESGIQSLYDLDGREVMFQADLIYINFLESMGIDLHLIPMDWSLVRYMSDTEFVQQCFLTSEPLVVARQGVDPGVIPMSESGFDPYRHVYTHENMVEERPEIVKAFIRASIRGWEDFMTGDPKPAFKLIRESNPQQTEPIMQEIVTQMKAYNLTGGNAEKDEELGQYNRARLEKILQQMIDNELLDGPVTLEESVALDLLPEHLLVNNPL